MNNRGKFLVRNIISAMVAILVVAFLFFTIFNIAFNLIFVKTDVRGVSMQPTLNLNIEDKEADGDVVYINKYADAKVNDVVVADVSWNYYSIIKRLVGTPKDTVKIERKDDVYYLYNNDRLLYTKPSNYQSDSYVCGAINNYQVSSLPKVTWSPLTVKSYFNLYNKFEIKLKDDEYFLMGDNWTDSMLDCTKKEPIKKSDIAGRVDILVKYTETDKYNSLLKSVLNLITGKRIKL